MAPGSCEICRVLGTGSVVPVVARRTSSGRRGRVGSRFGAGVTVAAVIVALLVVMQVVALAWAVVRLAQLVLVAAVAGTVGWRLGVIHGRRTR